MVESSVVRGPRGVQEVDIFLSTRKQKQTQRNAEVDAILCTTFRASVRRWLLTMPVTAVATIAIFFLTDSLPTGLLMLGVLGYGAVIHVVTLRSDKPNCERWPAVAYSSYLASGALVPAFALPESLAGQIALLLVAALGLPLCGILLSANRSAALVAIAVAGVATTAGWNLSSHAFDSYMPEVIFIAITIVGLCIVEEVASQQIKLATSSLLAQTSKEIDPLTGLYRRSTFLDLVEQSTLDGQPGGLYFVNIDRFKVINDTLGHQAGDQLLIATARRIRRSLGTDDFAGRIGDDEIAVFIPAQKQDEIAATALRLTGTFAEDFRLIDNRVPVSATISAVCADGTTSGATLMHHADIAMHAAKRDSRPMRIFDNQMQAELGRLQQTELDLRAALKAGEIGAHLQPIVNLTTGTVTAFEALGRWTKDGSAVAAADFFTSAKQSNLLPDITRAVAADLIDFSSSLSKLSQTEDQSDIPAVGINVEAGDLGAFLTWLDRRPVDPTNWVVELTETQILNNYDEAVRDVRRADAMGIGVVLDDFGTGYSSLSRILQLPLAGLKIDASFVAQLLHSPTAQTIVSSTVHIANSCGLSVVAEGVETNQQASALVDLGVTIMQGYYFCRPLDLHRSLAIVQDIKSDGSGPVALRPSRHMRQGEHFLCNSSDVERLVAQCAESSQSEQRSLPRLAADFR